MFLCYAKDPMGNFGDDLNEIVWPKLLPGVLDSDRNHLFIGIGTILNDRIPTAPRKTVFGAGYGYGAKPRLEEGQWEFHVVRGPITAKALDLDPRIAVTDPGILVRRIFPNGTRPRHHRVSFMPHHITDQSADWATLCEQAGIHYISPRGPLDQVADADPTQHAATVIIGNHATGRWGMMPVGIGAEKLAGKVRRLAGWTKAQRYGDVYAALAKKRAAEETTATPVER